MKSLYKNRGDFGVTAIIMIVVGVIGVAAPIVKYAVNSHLEKKREEARHYDVVLRNQTPESILFTLDGESLNYVISPNAYENLADYHEDLWKSQGRTLIFTAIVGGKVNTKVVCPPRTLLEGSLTYTVELNSGKPVCSVMTYKAAAAA